MTRRARVPGRPGSPAAGDPYAAIAAFYDAEWDGADADAAFYGRRGRSGRLLVAGCGTGRICRALEGSRKVVGIDRSAAMIARARRRGAALRREDPREPPLGRASGAPPSPSARALALPASATLRHPASEFAGRGGTRYEAADMTTFDAGEGAFAEVVVPNGAFAFLPTRRDQSAALGRLRRALAPGGALWIDLPMPDFARLCERHTPERPAWEGHVGGRPATRSREAFREPERGRLRLIDRYRLGGELIATTELDLRVPSPSEAEWMLEACGFVVDEVLGGYGGEPLGAGAERLLVGATRLD